MERHQPPAALGVQVALEEEQAALPRPPAAAALGPQRALVVPGARLRRAGAGRLRASFRWEPLLHRPLNEWRAAANQPPCLPPRALLAAARAQVTTEQQFDAKTHQMTGTLLYECVTAMPQYAGLSLEELRLNVRSLPRPSDCTLTLPVRPFSHSPSLP